MKSILPFVVLLNTIAMVGALALELTGALAASFNALHALASFVVALVMLTLVNDYTARSRISRFATLTRADDGTPARAEHALAA